MPHSTTDGGDTRRYSQVGAKTMNSASSISNGRSGASSSIDNKWKRASLPVSDLYSEYGAQRGRSGSMVSNGAVSLSNRRSQYYDDSREGTLTERVLKNSPIIAELRTNVIIKDEYTLVTDLSYHLTVRYSKPDSAIMINIDHSSCLALAGTFDPCYILTITAISSHLGPSINKRNAGLIQNFMADILSVPPERGIIRFVAMPEENYATNGNTVLGEVERAEKQSGIETSVKRALTDSRRSVPSYKKSAADLDQRKTNGIAERDERSDREKRADRRKSTAASTTTTPGEVFELPADSDERPPTSRGENSAAGLFAAENGLRMNGISKEDLRTPNGRPKTIAIPPSSSAPSNASSEALPPSKPKHISAAAKTEQKAAYISKSNGSARPVSVPNRQHSSGTRSLGNVSNPITLKETIVDNPKILKSDTKYDSDTAANTAKRRSTITATPKMPAPPPVPESKTPKVSKRKSFLSAFRR